VVLWGAVAENDADTKLFLNLPSDGYNNDTNAINDVDNTALYTVPRAYAGVGWLLSRLTVKKSSGGNTWTIIANTDLRGVSPSTFPGGVVIGGAGVTDHGLLTGLGDDDHIKYPLTDGTRGFSATVSGVDPVDSDDLATKSYVDSVATTALTIEQVTTGEDISFFYTDTDRTVKKLIPSIRGTEDQGTTWTLRYAPVHVSGTGTEVTTGGTTTHSGNSGNVITSFDNATIAGGSFVWMETTTASGNIDEFSLTLI
jgi:hypothetical protein